ncbi:MAG: cytochrome c [Myxococcota bacterium]
MRRLLVLTALLVAPAALSAPPSAASIVKYRHAVMSALGGHMGALSLIAKGESDRKQDRLAHATAIRDLAKTVPDLFPAGSGPSATLKTDAKAEIWTQHDKFDGYAKALQDESAKLVDALTKGDEAAASTAFRGVGGACGDCHDSFKVKDD